MKFIKCFAGTLRLSKTQFQISGTDTFPFSVNSTVLCLLLYLSFRFGVDPPRHSSTFCWFWLRGMGALSLACGTHPFHSSSPCTCSHRFSPLPVLPPTVAQARLKSGARNRGTRPRQPVFVRCRRFWSWDQGHLDRSGTWGRACSYSSGSTSQVFAPCQFSEINLLNIQMAT